MRGRVPRWRWVAAGSGVLCAVAAAACALSWGSIFDALLKSQMALTPSSRSFREWRVPSLPLYLEFYLYNWTNADKFPEEKPNLVQLGPYRFQEQRIHVNITWHNHNSSVGYRISKRWYFDPSSKGNLNDNVTTLNAVAASAIYLARDWGFLQQKGLAMALAMFGQHISISKQAGELLFDGYDDPLLDLAKSLPSSTTGGPPPVDKFGWFYGRNDSINSEGYMVVSTGVESGTLPGQILQWNYMDRLPYYSGKCAELSGSAGQFLPRGLTENDQLTMFIPDLCRTVHLEYQHSGILDGLQYHKYALTERNFDNSSISLSNTCFCSGQCSWSGVMNVSTCRLGSPAFISLPHYLYGDPALREQVTGMEPDEDIHSLFFAVEPKLGIPLEVAARFQLNIYIEPNPNIALYENVPRMLFPVLWIQQYVKMDKNITTELRYVRAFMDWGGVVCACVALFFAAVVTMASFYLKKSQYVPPHDAMTFDTPKDETETKLNPM